ncbi:hypothetical protein [Solimonas soli]|uniref:hypothetical protein n=1 Tax=Solimonas soli TaxID=413479 RepID=UPI0012F8866B|nr:hypothetical protein [Solimonas soli]
MAILSDIFVATPTEAFCYTLASRGFHRIQLKGLTNLEFGTLWAIMQGAAFDFDTHDLKELNNSGSTWLFQFPATFVSDLAALNEAAIAAAAAPWAESEELQWPVAEAQSAITALAQLSRAAQGSEGVVPVGQHVSMPNKNCGRFRRRRRRTLPAPSTSATSKNQLCGIHRDERRFHVRTPPVG